jgi:hypothetical protein
VALAGWRRVLRPAPAQVPPGHEAVLPDVPTIAEGAVDLGQHEMLDEVLGVDVGACAAQYVVAEYMTATKDERPRAVRSAIEQIECVGSSSDPLREMERVAVEPLAGPCAVPHPLA